MARVIVFDDNTEFVHVLQEILESEGHAVSTSSVARVESLSEIRQADAILIDVWFGKQKAGLQLVAHLKNMLDSTVKIILMSSDSDLARYAAQVAADDYIRKPFDIPQLLRIVSG